MPSWKSASLIEDNLLGVFNECLDQGRFPSRWRIADLRLIYEGGGKDKAYRPICLLPVVSNLLESLMVNSLRPVFIAASHPRQFSSTRGKGTTDALLRVRRDVGGKAVMYVMIVLFDISSAFDSVWWPCVLQRLQEVNTPSNLYSLVSSYLSDRSVRIRGSYYEVEREDSHKGRSLGRPYGS